MSEEMTREQACNTLRNAAWLGTNEERELIEKAVELLCGEPCEYAIDRHAVLDMMQMRLSGKELYKAVYELPPVTPKQRTGHWIESRCDMYECSECDHTYTDLSGERYGMNYCPNCGAMMEEMKE